MRKRQQKVENVLKTQLLDLKNSLAVNLLHTALSNGWDQKFALRLRNINQDGIDHINFQLITIHFQLITTRSFKNDSVFCSQARKNTMHRRQLWKICMPNNCI